MRKLMILIICISLLTACMTQMTGIAPSSTPITSEDSYTILGHTKGFSYGFMLYVIPFFEFDPSKKALERAINKAGADALIEVTQDYNALFLYFVSIYWTRVEGTAVKVQRGETKI